MNIKKKLAIERQIWNAYNIGKGRESKNELTFSLAQTSKMVLSKLLSHELHYMACCSQLCMPFVWGNFSRLVWRFMYNVRPILWIYMCVCVYQTPLNIYLHKKYVVNDIVNIEHWNWVSGRYKNKLT